MSQKSEPPPPTCVMSFVDAPFYLFQEPDYVYVDGNGVDYETEFKDIEDGPDVNFTFTPLEYDNYDVDQFGNLDLTKPKFPPPSNSNGQTILLFLIAILKMAFTPIHPGT